MTVPHPMGDRPEPRAERASVLLVGEDVRMRALAAQLRRLGTRVREAKAVTEALALVGAAPAREPILTVIVCVRAPYFDLEQVASAFNILDATLPVCAALSADELELDAELIANGFESSLELPASDAALRELLDDCGMPPQSPAAPAAPTAPVASTAPNPPAPPQPKDVVELEVEKAQERATHEPVSGPTEPAPAAKPPEPPKPAPRAAPTPPPPAPPAPAIHANLGDADLADALAAGDPIEPLALAIVRIQLRAEDVRFASRARPAEREAIARERARRGRNTAEVRITLADGSSTVFGELISETVPAERLAPWAAWLASWLRLDERVAELTRLATTDELTGAGNRRAFREAFAAASARARATRRTLSLMYFDLDDFKRYNDEHGHETGDEVLRETVELLRQTIRKGDRIFRFGGDEFVVLFANGARGPDEGGDAPESIELLADRFRRALKELALPQLGAQGAGTITVSGGVSVFPWDAGTADELIRLAEERARRSKAEGKNVITFGPMPEDPDPDDADTGDPTPRGRDS